MARSLLVQNRRLVTAPGTRSIIAFDDVTGAGAECCCGGGSPSVCCKPTAVFDCGWGPSVAPNRLTCPVNANRIDIAMTGTATHDEYKLWDDGSLNGYLGLKTQTLDSSHNIFFQYVDQAPPTGDCLNYHGYAGTNSRHYVETFKGANTRDYTATTRDGLTNGTGLANAECFGHAFDFPSTFLNALYWSAWQSRGVSGTAVPYGLANFMFDQVEQAAGNFGGFNFMSQLDFLASDATLNGKTLDNCSGTKTKTVTGSLGYVATLVWSVTKTCAGGTAHAHIYYNYNNGYYNRIVLDFSWAVTFSCTDSTGGGSSSATTPNSLLGI